MGCQWDTPGFGASQSLQAMVGFLQRGGYSPRWRLSWHVALIEVKRIGQQFARAFSPHAYPLLCGGQNNRLGMQGPSPHDSVLYI